MVKDVQNIYLIGLKKRLVWGVLDIEGVYVNNNNETAFDFTYPSLLVGSKYVNFLPMFSFQGSPGM